MQRHPISTMNKMNHASSLIIEDHLKHVLTRTGGKPFKTSNNKNLPRALHSAFGDFPKDYMAKGQGMAMMPKPLDQAELSVAATAVSKYSILYVTLLSYCWILLFFEC